MADTGSPAATRLLALGSSVLMEGFSLIGAETYPEATAETVERVLGGLLKRQEKALVFLEHHLARDPGPSLRRVRDEGGRIVVAEIPPLHAPETHRPAVEDVIRAILGPQALEPRT
jgi:vacuolar-type H+-ATPase subunit F/Vma7